MKTHYRGDHQLSSPWLSLLDYLGVARITRIEFLLTTACLFLPEHTSPIVQINGHPPRAPQVLKRGSAEYKMQYPSWAKICGLAEVNGGGRGTSQAEKVAYSIAKSPVPYPMR